MVELVNQYIQHARTSHFRTSDILTTKIMAAKKVWCSSFELKQLAIGDLKTINNALST